MQLLKLLQFECRFHSKQRAFIVFLVLFVVYGILAISSERQFLENSTMYNDAFNLNLLSGMISLGALLPCMLFCINGLIRELTYKSEGIIFSTGLTKIKFFTSRFIAIFIFTLFLSSFSMLGVFAGTLISNSNPEALHAFNFLHYLSPWFIFILPNAFIISALLFSATLLSRNAIITYIVGVLIIGFYWISAFTINSPLMGGSSLSSPEIVSKVALIDIFGLTPFFEQTQFLTPVEKNDYLLSFSGYLLWNRILWIAIAILSLLISYRLFSFRKVNTKLKKAVTNKKETSTLIQYTTVKTESKSAKARIISFWSLVRIDFKSTLKGIPFLAFMLMWVVLLTFSFDYSTNRIEVYGSPYPTTDLILGSIIEVLPIFGLLLVVFYSGELVWKTRSYKFNGIIDSTPVRNSVFFSSKLVVLTLIPIVLILTSLLTGIVFQLINGYYDLNISLYLSTFYYGGLQLMLYVIFCLFIQSIVSNKYLGMVISGLVIFLFGPLSESIGLAHPLLLFNNIPSMARTYSDFTGYGQYISKFNWIGLYWSLFSGILVLFSFKFWKRGLAKGFKIEKNWSLNEKVLIGALFLLFSSTGGVIFYNTNILNDYRAESEKYDFNENYEKKYKKYDALIVPKLVSVSTKMNLFTEENKYSVTAKNIITNSSSTPLTEIFVTAKTRMTSMQIDNSSQVFHDSILNTYLFKLNEPLQPNHHLKMSYKVDKKSTGFNIDNAIAKNGSYIKNTHFSPFLGYVNRFEISDPYQREKRGLPLLENTVIIDEHLDKDAKFNYEKVLFQTVISTNSNQKAFSSGELVKHWKKDERNYYHYKSKGKIDNQVAYFSGKYQIEKVIHKGIKIELYHLPEHSVNVLEMIKIAKATIDYCTNNFGAYPHKYLRIGEVSTFSGSNGQAMPGVISINERIFKKSNENPESFNVIARVLIHEISHQWWGLLLTPKQIEGAMFISESLAKYSETVILEKLYGKAIVNRLSEYTMRNYFSGRSRANLPEPALYLTAHQQHLSYSKGAINLNAIRNLIGEKELNTALKNLIIKFKEEATVTTLNFLEELYEVAPQKHHTLIDDWLKRVITYDLGVKTATYKKLKNNTYEVKAVVSTKRYQTNKKGNEDKIDINEYINIGIFKNKPKKYNKNEILYMKSHLINEEELEFSFIVNEVPKYISIDPYYTRLDRNISDHIKLIIKE